MAKILFVQTWEFYYETTDHSETIMKVWTGKDPSKTSTWKNLRKMFNALPNDMNFVPSLEQIGYRVVEK